ncbi:succinate dehydrogenase cytochrome B558 [Bacillus tropicus]|mgnify:FL=1|jgi:succinate dehydrogenase / fumarate reductase cytochrome b subunit|uniref:Succinate dehydrogenase cytochrome b558 subunit n=50 Tax=Bacillaceae TaxID=186817 RepID=Q817M0_BACCR|nr:MULTISPECIES: succinate dehydrogenase cytochrome B558 [Bacillus]AFU15218.1 succinate dehydrogenase cytochrome b558 subunit [Bacillus thuringiensis MC28]AJH73369.1 succinate dehydrogenase cytochrome b558 subunit [Bacillus cereus ATCC 4342]AJI05378.1 succinate dehydrogenase cytochrome b558 subunit [Bacillus cereus G9241]AZJ22592.1 succinate dehydrogenase [Bacillus wiedmannii bv. thuringiensis]EAO53302.1 Succinate dehydrogenase cytochrome b558 subunit [Bacillus thuringiensis serovar israelensi
MKGREYTFRKWHSLMGVIPVGVFLTQHLIVNNFATRGAEAFNKAAGFMELLPFRYALEIFIIFLPILYHAIYGLYIAFTAKNNAVSYGYFRNWMFVFQRISGIVTLIFISWHVWETRIQAMLGKEVNYDMMADILNNPAMFAFYLVGVVSTIFHFANGLWTFCISWGITVSPRSQRISTYVTLAIFLGLSYVGVSALLAFIDPQLANQ